MNTSTVVLVIAVLLSVATVFFIWKLISINQPQRRHVQILSRAYSKSKDIGMMDSKSQERLFFTHAKLIGIFTAPEDKIINFTFEVAGKYLYCTYYCDIPFSQSIERFSQTFVAGQSYSLKYFKVKPSRREIWEREHVLYDLIEEE